MKISLNWAQYYSNVDLLKHGKDKLLEKIGQQLGEIEEVVEWGPRYGGIKVVKVVSCVKHPNADKLSVCTIDDGGKTASVKRDKNGHIQVVCGAPNVHAGMLAVWIPPGVTVPSSLGKDPFVLEAREIRGVVSNGMLASASELALGDDHSGILEVKEAVKPGTPFKELYGMDDLVIDIENKMFTHRPDCFGVLGVARELAGIQHLAFKSPDWYQKPTKTYKSSFHGLAAETKKEGVENLQIEVKNEIPKLVQRFMAVAIAGVNITPSPMWLQATLVRVGIRPINNIVDITNYVMMLTGQPLHAYDYDKVRAESREPAYRTGRQRTEITARSGKKGEKLKLLGGKEITLREQDIVIANGKKAIGLGGVMGGANTEVDENTKNIILEAANFDMYAIRKTAMEHGLFTDAVTRFTKGQSPLQIDRAIAYAMKNIFKTAGGTQASQVIDNNHAKANKSVIRLDVSFVNERLGLNLSGAEMKKLLENVEIDAEQSGGTLRVSAPFWRTDLAIPEDIVEEVGRLYGYQHLPLQLPTRTAAPPPVDELLATKQRLRQLLASAGANEVLTYSFVHGNLLDKVGQNKKLAYQVANALSPDLQYYRLSIVPSLLDKVHANIKAGYSEFALFEINPIHSKDLVSKADGLPIEDQRLGLVFAADEKVAKGNYSGAAYYQAKKYLEAILSHFGIEPAYTPATHYEPKMGVGKAALAPFGKSRAALVKTKDGQLLAELGEFRTEVQRNLKLPTFSAGFELDVGQLIKSQNKASYVPLPRFPRVEQDISLRLKTAVSHQELSDFLQLELAKEKPGNTWYNLVALDIYQKKPGDAQKQLTFRLAIASYERTLTAELVNTLLDAVAAKAKAKFGAVRI
jgi:phenylalanyl-tRNA synthetase beta chain